MNFEISIETSCWGQVTVEDANGDTADWARVGGWAMENMWATATVKATFPSGWSLPSVVEALVDAGFTGAVDDVAWTCESVPEKDWVADVHDSRPPIRIGKKLRFRFPWHDAPGELSAYDVLLEGGAGFGTGEHATTQMCCEWLEAHSAGQRVLDYGTGSGILALASLRCGAQFATGVDIDRDALASARRNAAQNGLDARCCWHLPRDERVDHRGDEIARAASASPGSELTPLPADAGVFDVLVANILAEPLTRLAPSLAALVKPGGGVALSGVLETQAAGVLAAFAPSFDLELANSRDGWVLLAGHRRSLSFV